MHFQNQKINCLKCTSRGQQQCRSVSKTQGYSPGDTRLQSRGHKVTVSGTQGYRPGDTRLQAQGHKVTVLGTQGYSPGDTRLQPRGHKVTVPGTQGYRGDMGSHRVLAGCPKMKLARLITVCPDSMPIWHLKT